MNDFTKEEILAAKATRQMILNSDSSELKSVYMAGEICMWDELQQNKNNPPAKELIKKTSEFNEPDFQQILKDKRYYYGHTEAAIEFAAEEFARQYVKEMNAYMANKTA